MISSFKDIAAAMTRCVSIIEDYARFSPAHLQSQDTDSTTAALTQLGLLSGLNATTPIDPALKKERRPREKKIRDPNAPKRPPSAYILFQNEVRDQLRRQNPEMAYREILNVIAVKWKELNPEQKKVSRVVHL